MCKISSMLSRGKCNINMQVEWGIGRFGNRISRVLGSLEGAVIGVMWRSGYWSTWIMYGRWAALPTKGWIWVKVGVDLLLTHSKTVFPHVWALTIEKLERLWLLSNVSETSICSVPISAKLKVKQFWLSCEMFDLLHREQWGRYFADSRLL